MTDSKKVHEGKVIPPKKSPRPGLEAFNALHQVVDAANECFVVHEQEKTKRARLHAYENTEVAKIKAAESVLKDYFAQVFRERREVYEGFFRRLDEALERDDAATAHAALRGIVDVARQSPLADLGDLGQIRAALDDPNQQWEL